MILAPATMTAEKDPKEAARKCLEEIGLDPDSYRVGHTKAREHEPLGPLVFQSYRNRCRPVLDNVTVYGHKEMTRHSNQP